MNGISQNLSVNTALLQSISEQVSETGKAEKNEATQEVSTRAGVESLGQNQVSTTDIDGAKSAPSTEDISSGTPLLGTPDKESGDDLSKGTGSKLFGEMDGAGMILQLMLETLDGANKTRQLQREVSTTQQNISIQEGMNQAEKTLQSADKQKTSAIIQGVVGGLGTGMSLGGLAGMNKGIGNALGGKVGGSAGKVDKLQGQLTNNLGKQAGLVNKEFSAARKGAQGLSSGDKSKLTKLQENAKALQNKLEAAKNPASSMAKQLSETKRANIQAAMQAFSGVTNTVNNGMAQGIQAEITTLQGKGMLDGIRSETAKTERSKSEANYDASKASITALMRVMGDILTALNNSASAAARA